MKYLYTLLLIVSGFVALAQNPWGGAQNIKADNYWYLGIRGGASLSQIRGISETLISNTYSPATYETHERGIWEDLGNPYSWGKSLGVFLWVKNMDISDLFAFQFEAQFAEQRSTFNYSDVDGLTYGLDVSLQSIDLMALGKVYPFMHTEWSDPLKGFFAELGASRAFGRNFGEILRFSSDVPDLENPQNDFLDAYVEDNLNDVLRNGNNIFVMGGIGYEISFSDRYGKIGLLFSLDYFYGFYDAIATLDNGYNFENPKNLNRGVKASLGIALGLNAID